MWVDVGAAPRHHVQRLDQLGMARSLEHVAAGTEFDGAAQVVRIVVHGQHHYGRRVVQTPQPLQDLEAPHALHAEIEQHDVNIGFLEQVEQSRAVSGLGDGLDRIAAGEHQLGSFAHNRVIVDDDESHPSPSHRAALVSPEVCRSNSAGSRAVRPHCEAGCGIATHPLWGRNAPADLPPTGGVRVPRCNRSGSGAACPFSAFRSSPPPVTTAARLPQDRRR